MKDFFELFLTLISNFVAGDINPTTFKIEYMHLWRECRDEGAFGFLSASNNESFDRIFTACDAYCENPDLRDPGDLDERQFINEVAIIARSVRR